MAFHGIYTVLKIGSKTSPQSRQWYGEKAQERNKDPLLLYLNQARNADEHGLAPVAKFKKPTATIIDGTGDASTIKRIETSDNSVTLYVDESLKNIPLIRLSLPAVVLVEVRDDRFGGVFPPPREHMGKPVEPDHPLPIAQLAVAYMSALVEEAAGLAAASTAIAK